MFRYICHLVSHPTVNIREEGLQDTAGLLVDEAGDPLDDAPPRQAADGGLGDAWGTQL